MSKHEIKKLLVAILRPGLRTYVRYAPWKLWMPGAIRLFDAYVGWRQHREVVRTLWGDHMELALPDLISSRIYLTGQWEPVVTRQLRSRLRRGDTFVDVGANVGYYSVMASRLVGESGRVFAIEASEGIFKQLTRNLEINHCKNVAAINAAAADAKGHLSTFLPNKSNRGGTTVVPSLALRQGFREESTVTADTLGSLVGMDTLRGARLIKIDVEGAESIVLAPLLNSLREFHRDTEWLLELSPEMSPGGDTDIEKIFQKFMSAGYHAYMIPNSYDVDFTAGVAVSEQLSRLSAPPQIPQYDVLMTQGSRVQ